MKGNHKYKIKYNIFFVHFPFLSRGILLWIELSQPENGCGNSINNKIFSWDVFKNILNSIFLYKYYSISIWISKNTYCLLSKSKNKNEIGFLLSYDQTCTTVWLHHLDINETLGEKARLKLNKDTALCFEQILEEALSKTVAVRPFIFHLMNHPNKTKKMLGTASEVRTNPYVVFSYTETCQSWLTSKNLYSSAQCGHWMLSRGLTKCGGW